MTLKKIYRHPGYNDTYHFEEWVKSTNPGVTIQNGLKVKVSLKEGRRRKLKTRVLSWELTDTGCTCCDPWIEMSFN